MLTDLEISNLALGHLGCERITSLSDTNNRANLCNQYLSISRDYTLEMSNWDFATKRASLTSTGTPAFEWSHQVEIPSDLIKIISEYNGVEYKREGDLILSDATTLLIKYIYRIDEDVQRSASFDSAWSLVLASMMAYALTQSLPVKGAMMQEAEAVVGKAASYNAMGSSPDNYEFNVFTDSRY